MLPPEVTQFSQDRHEKYCGISQGTAMSEHYATVFLVEKPWKTGPSLGPVERVRGRTAASPGSRSGGWLREECEVRVLAPGLPPSRRGNRLRDEYEIGAYEEVLLEDVKEAVHHLNDATGMRRREWAAWRDNLIRRCYDGGDVTRRQLAEVAGLSPRRIDMIRQAPMTPAGRPSLRIVR
jgi:hypothetical protein